MSKSKELTKELERARKEEGMALLNKHKTRIRDYIARHGHYYTFGITSAVVDDTGDYLVVFYNVGRRDPLFEDYDDSKRIPLEYLECDDPKLFIDLELAAEKKIREDEAKKVLDKKIQDLKYQIASDQRRLKELMEKGY